MMIRQSAFFVIQEL